MPLKQSIQKRSLHVSHLIVKTYEEARRAVEQLGILPTLLLTQLPSLPHGTRVPPPIPGTGETASPPKELLPMADVSALAPS